MQTVFNKSKRSGKRLAVISMAAVMAMTGSSLAVFADDSIDTSYTKADEYLSEYFNIEKSEDVSLDSVNKMLDALGGEEIEADALTDEEIIAAGIELAGLEELALTYVSDKAPDKAAATLEAYGAEASEEYAPYIACALDQGLIKETAVPDVADYFYRCTEAGGNARRYIGRVSDDNILEKLHTELSSYTLFENEELNALGVDIVLSGATTGYGLKYAGNDARFLSEYTLQYGHSDEAHAAQLIGLLRSEGVDAYVQAEPKISVYEYLPDWGDPGEPTPTYKVVEADEDRYLCYAAEYDLQLEFDTVEEKEAFHDLIETYAKKYDDSFDEDGNLTALLLDGSWWQPLYSSKTPVQNEEFGELIDNVIYDASGEYSIHSFSIPENTAAIEEETARIAPDLSVSQIPIYANPAFIRYITGEDYQ